MRVFMLGWEFPPFISGGLGTACYGLTKALSQKSVDVTFVLPKAIGSDYQPADHVTLLAPQAPQAAHGDRSPQSVASVYSIDERDDAFEHVTFKAVPARLPSPYGAAAPSAEPTPARGNDEQSVTARPRTTHRHAPRPRISVLGYPASEARYVPGQGLHYGGDLMMEARRYAGLCVDLARGERFDVIHAHDWLTFPAGMAVAAVTGKPLVVHVHSTEFDRAGENVNQMIYDIERRGIHSAMRVIAVSHLTRQILVHRYGIESTHVDVAYNGIDSDRMPAWHPRTRIARGDKVVLFLGRITMQKGPEYFVRAAKKVLERVENVKFVMAGSGDMAGEVIELAAREGIGQRVLFTGFLRGPDVERVFRMADVFVMPSVSEPFGIAALEAISHDVPVIISRTSGASEVLRHALKVDFWDTNDIANKIIAVLRHPPLSSTLREQADFEVRQLTWSEAADQCLSTYRAAIAMMP